MSKKKICFCQQESNNPRPVLSHQLFFLFWLKHMAGLGVSAIESGDDQRQLWAEQHQPYAARNHV